MAAQQFLRFNRQQVPVHHRRGLDEVLGQRDGRQLKRKTARLQNAAAHFLGPLLEVRVAVADVAPGIDDGDDRTALPVGMVVTHLHGARAVPERAEVVGREPAGAAQLFVGLAGWSYVWR